MPLSYSEIEQAIPYKQYGERHQTEQTIWTGGNEVITVGQPGKYQEKTDGGDFVVRYTGMLQNQEVKAKQVTYQQLFKHWTQLHEWERQCTLDLLEREQPKTGFEVCCMVLSVAEYRRYAKYEYTVNDKSKLYAFAWPQKRGTKVEYWLGGRWLLLNFLRALHIDSALLDEASKLVKLGSKALPILAKSMQERC